MDNAPDIIPPHSIEAEVTTLGSMILSGDAIPVVKGIVGARDFYRPEHQTIFSAIVNLVNGGAPVDLVSLVQHLRDKGELDGVGGPEYVVDLAQGTPSADNAEYYAKIVKEKAVRRSFLEVAGRLRKDAADNSIPLQDLAGDLRISVDGLVDGNGGGPIRPSPISAADLLAKFPMMREPIIDGIIRRGEVGNLVSLSKHFKSWLLLHLGLCVAFGRSMFGFPTRAGRVLMLDYELAGGTLAKRLQYVASAMNLTPGEIGDRLAIEPLRGKRLDIGDLGLYFAALPPGRWDLILIDPLYRIFPPDLDENSNANLANIYATLQGHAERLDAGLMVVHHLTKGDQSFKSITDLGAGGGSQSRAADAHLAIRPHREDDAAVFAGVVRSFPPFEPMAIRWRFPLWELAPDLDPADLKRATPRPKAPPKEPAPAPPLPSWDPARFVVDFLSAEPKARAAITAAAVEKGLSERRAGKLLESAEGQGKAHRWDMGKDRRVYYATRPQPKLTNGDDHGK